MAATTLSPTQVLIHGLRLWLEDRARFEHIEECLRRDLDPIPSSVRAVLQTAIREHGRIGFLLRPRIEKPPHAIVRAALHAALAETFLRTETSPAPIIHHWVDFVRQTRSLPESRFANAILRGCLRDLPNLSGNPEWLRASHPLEWIRHWESFLKPADLNTLLEWDQRVPPTYLRWLDSRTEPPPALSPTQYPAYLICPPELTPMIGDWYREGLAIVQDPAQRHPAELAIAEQASTILDACAAPGGKSIAIAANSRAPLQIVANDIPGPRQIKLATDLAALPFRHIKPAEHDFRTPPPSDWVGRFDVVLADVPCSNTGVFRRHPDAKWRHHPEQLRSQTRLQHRILENTATCVRPGGLLIYSTCSIEPSENRTIVDDFCIQNLDTKFLIEKELHSSPWTDQIDGGATFALRRQIR